MAIPNPQSSLEGPGGSYQEVISTSRSCDSIRIATQPLVYDGEYSDMIDTIDNGGTVNVPDAPDLGVEYDWDYIQANQTGSVHIYE